MKHGVIETPGRIQPYTVWVKGQVVYFTADKVEARVRFMRETTRR